MKISVVIPVYQVEAFIEECLASVRNQTFGDMEILCINDCTEDSSWNIVKNAAERDGRIRLLSNEENIGLASTRNKGLDNALGDYIYFLDSDDKIAPDTLEQLIRRAEDEDLDVIAFCADFIYEDEELKEKFCRNPAVFKADYPDVMRGKELYIHWMDHWDWMPSQPRFFYRRDFLLKNDIRFPEGMLHEDEIFTFDVLMKARRVRVCSEKWFIRRFRRNSIMTGVMTYKNVEGCIRILQHVAARREEYRDDPTLTAAVHYYCKKIAENCRRKYATVLKSASEHDHDMRVSEEGPFVSVLIPIYNCAPYLEDCLISVLSQSLIDLEVICVDDASTDNSWKILSEFAQMDPRVRLFRHQENRGQAAARNTALDLARGQMIYMLDADDWIVEGALQKMYEYMVSDDLDVLGFENRQFAEDEVFAEQAATVLFSYEDTEGLYNGRDAFVTCVEKDTLSPSVPTFMLKKEYILRTHLRFEEGILHEDIGYIFDMLTRAERVRLVHKAFFCRRFRAHSTVTGGFTVRHVLGYLKSWQKVSEQRGELLERFGEDPVFWHACRKWTRDIAGRIRVLYLHSEKDLYLSYPPSSEEPTAPLMELLRQATTGPARAEDILGKEMIQKLEQAGSVYICGSGQYAHRILDVVGALDVEICGVLERNGLVAGRKNFRGFPVLDLLGEADHTKLVVLAVSHYQAEEYRKALTEAGFTRLCSVSF